MWWGGVKTHAIVQHLRPLHHCTHSGTPTPDALVLVDVALGFPVFQFLRWVKSRCSTGSQGVRRNGDDVHAPSPGLHLIPQPDNPDIRVPVPECRVCRIRGKIEGGARIRTSRPRLGVAGVTAVLPVLPVPQMPMSVGTQRQAPSPAVHDRLKGGDQDDGERHSQEGVGISLAPLCEVPRHAAPGTVRDARDDTRDRGGHATSRLRGPRRGFRA
jgi:hypothetical protein